MDKDKKTYTKIVPRLVKIEGSDETKIITVFETRSFRVGELGKLAENATNDTIKDYLEEWVSTKASDLGWKLDGKCPTYVLFEPAPRTNISLTIFTDTTSERVKHCLIFDVNVSDSIVNRIKHITVIPGQPQVPRHAPWTLGSVCQCPSSLNTSDEPRIPTVAASAITEPVYKGRVVQLAELDGTLQGKVKPVPYIVLPDIDKETLLKARTKSFGMLSPQDQGHLTAMEQVMHARTMEQVLEAEKKLEAYEQGRAAPVPPTDDSVTSTKASNVCQVCDKFSTESERFVYLAEGDQVQLVYRCPQHEPIWPNCVECSKCNVTMNPELYDAYELGCPVCKSKDSLKD